MTTVTYEAFVYLPKYTELSDVQNGNRIPSFDFEDGNMAYAEHGYPLIGKASITLYLHSPDKIVQEQIEALNRQLQNERAESQQRQNAILNQISKLQALTFAEAS